MTAAQTPYSYRRTVRWGDCDPAGIVYTPRVFDYVLEAMEGWYRDVVGIDWVTLNQGMGMGAPTVRAECDFMRAPRPDQVLDLEVRIERVGRGSLTFVVTATDEAGQHYFRSLMVACFVARGEDGFDSIAIPDDIRQRIVAYQGACGDS